MQPNNSLDTEIFHYHLCLFTIFIRIFFSIYLFLYTRLTKAKEHFCLVKMKTTTKQANEIEIDEEERGKTLYNELNEVGCR
jgi:hypothetical protein